MSRAKINAPLHTPRVLQTLAFGSSEHLVIALETIKSSDMNTIIMNQDALKSAISRRDNRSELPLSSRLGEIVHTPAFIKADASNKTDNIKQQPTSPKQVRHFGWTRFIELTILLSIVIGAIWLTSKIVTPQVVTVVSVIAGFLILRFIVRVILKVTITLLSILFWLAILCAILLCVL